VGDQKDTEIAEGEEEKLQMMGIFIIKKRES